MSHILIPSFPIFFITVVPELEVFSHINMQESKVTEIQVRMDCNGCVQKIKKALHGINGIHDIYIDIPQQKLAIIGWADPEKIVKAIKKIRKTATICSQTTLTEPEQPLEGETPPSGEEASPTEPPPIQENPPPADMAPSRQYTEFTIQQQQQQPESSGLKEVEEIHTLYHNPPDHKNNVRVYSERVDHYLGSYGGSGFKHEPPQPIHVNHSYNTYKPTPYVTEYEYIQPTPQYVPYSRPEPPRYTSYSWPEPPQQQHYTHYSQPEPAPQYYRKPELPPPQQYSRPESPPLQQNYSRPKPPPQNNSRSQPPSQNHSWSETPQPYTRPEPPRQTFSRPDQPQQSDRQPEPPRQTYSRPEPPPQNYSPPEPPPQHYSQPGPPQQNRTDPPQYYSQPAPPQQYTHYSHPESPQQYTHYIRPESPREYTRNNRPEPSPLHTYYSRFEPPEYMNDYHSSYRDSEFTSPFGDEDPNGCRIV